MIRKYCRVKGNNTKLVKHVENNSSINIGYIGYYLKKKKIWNHKTTFKFQVTTYLIVNIFLIVNKIQLCHCTSAFRW